MCDIRTYEALLIVQRLLGRAYESPDPGERAMAKSLSALMRRSYQLQRNELTRTLKPTERLEIVAAEERIWDGIRWLGEHMAARLNRKEPIQ